MPRLRTDAVKRLGTARVVSMVRASDAHPPPEAIATRAYELFLSRGGTHGDDLADWFAAEQELSQAPSQPAAKRTRRRLAS